MEEMKPPEQLELNRKSLAQTWNPWKTQFSLYADPELTLHFPALLGSHYKRPLIRDRNVVYMKLRVQAEIIKRGKLISYKHQQNCNDRQIL